METDEESSTSGDNEELVVSEKKRRFLNWTLDRIFADSNAAEAALKEENTWSLEYSRNSKDGQKRFYRCNKVKKRGPQCSARVHLLSDCTSDAVLLFRTETGHNHDLLNNISSTYGLNEAVKLEINKLLDIKMKPKSIMEILSKMDNIQVPTMTQLRNYIFSQRRFRYGNVISLREIRRFLLSSKGVPNDPHESFIISYELFKNLNESAFRFVISTKYLMELSKEVENLHIDTTSKLTWQGCSIFVIGTTDKDRKFHALFLAVASDEQYDDFKMIFNALKNKVHEYASVDLNPTVLVCDAKKNIYNAFTEVFGNDVKVRTCWTNAKREMQTEAEKNMEKLDPKEVMTDVDILHSITSPNIFNIASELFLQKYQDFTDFVEYFGREWLMLKRNWYLGADLGSPSTNSALESFNKAINNTNSLRQRLPLSRFSVLAKEMVSRWSNKYSTNPENNAFAKIPTITIKEWAEANNWAKLPKKITNSRKDEYFTYYEIPAGDSNICDDFENQWNHFDKFKEQYFTKWEVELPINNEWRSGKCSCPTFYELYKCKHIVGLAIHLKLATPPLEAKVIGEKRKRGRPPKSQKALIVA